MNQKMKAFEQEKNEAALRQEKERERIEQEKQDMIN